MTRNDDIVDLRRRVGRLEDKLGSAETSISALQVHSTNNNKTGEGNRTLIIAAASAAVLLFFSKIVDRVL